MKDNLAVLDNKIEELEEDYYIGKKIPPDTCDRLRGKLAEEKKGILESLANLDLEQKARKAGINVSEFLRQAAIAVKVTARLTDEERHIIRQLIGMVNNLNQMAKVANREGMGSIRLLLASCLQQVHGLLNKLQHGE